MDRVALVLPAFDAATLAATVDEVPSDFGQFGILVDDASADKTLDEGRALGLDARTHERNRA